MGERGSGGHKVGTLLNDRLTSRLVGLGNDHAEVLGAEEGGYRLFNKVETLLQPLGRLCETREGVGLPSKHKEDWPLLFAEDSTGIEELTFQVG